MDAPLAPNQIHSLPVRVSYHLQSSSQTFSTLFPTLQQVYVHPNAGSTKVDGRDEAWGAIYLKAVVQGIVMASPELHPMHHGTPDLSLYVLDPRETFLRRARVSAPMPHLRASPSSGTAEVWTGKGLVSWALDEPGQGKNLITGRLVPRAEFVGIGAAAAEGMSALEALAAANATSSGDTEAWGIEIAVGLKSSISASFGFPGPLHHSVEAMVELLAPERLAARVGADGSPKPTTTTPGSRPPVPSGLSSSSTGLPRTMQRVTTGPRVAAVPTRQTPARAAAAAVASTDPAMPSSEAGPSNPPVPVRRGPGRPPGSKTKKRTTPAERDRAKLSAMDTNRQRGAAAASKAEPKSDAPKQDAPKSDPKSDDTAKLISKADTMTKEDAQKLLQNPAILGVLEQLMGVPLNKTAAQKRAAPAATGDETKSKRARFTHPSSDTGHQTETLKCTNCGTTKSSVWRTKQDDGKVLRVCNACGLYWNKMRRMPTPASGSGASEDIKPDLGSSTGSESKAERADRLDKGSFKRTLTMVAEKDALRIANERASKLKTLTGAARKAAMTSPARPASSVPKSVRHATRAVTAAASSPGALPAASPNAGPGPGPASAPDTTTTAVAPTPNTVHESPGAAIRRILSDMPSLAMPLSDDGSGAAVSTANFTADLSAFFDVDGFSMAPRTDRESHTAEQSPVARADIRGVSSALRHSSKHGNNEGGHDGSIDDARFDKASSEDDVFSQLFQRTSSMGNLDASSPFDFSQLPPSSPPALPSNLPHSALLLSSPSGSPLDPSPRESECSEKVSPARSQSRLRNELTADKGASHATSPAESANDDTLQDLLSKLGGNVGDDLFALLNSFPAAAAT